MSMIEESRPVWDGTIGNTPLRVEQGVADEIADAVAQAKVGLPDPTLAARPPRKKRPRRPGPRPRRRRR